MNKRIIFFLIILFLTVVVSVVWGYQYFAWPDFGVYKQSLHDLFSVYSFHDLWKIKDVFWINQWLFQYIIVHIFWFQYTWLVTLIISVILYLTSLLFLVQYLTNKYNTSDCYLLSIVILFIWALWTPLLWYITNFQTISIIFDTWVGIFIFINIFKYIDTNYPRYLIYWTLLFLLIAHPPTQLMFLWVSMLFLLFSFNLKGMSILILLYFLTNFFWLFLFWLNYIMSSSSAFRGTGDYTSHIYSWYSSSANILNNSLFSIYPNDKTFHLFDASFYAFVYLLMFLTILLYFIFTKRRKNTFLVITIGVFFVLFTFSFGPNYFFGTWFAYLWENFPLIHFFRNFKIVLNLGFILFLMIFVISIINFKVRELYKKVILLLIIIALFFNFLRWFTNYYYHLSWDFIPDEYMLLEQKIWDSKILEWPYMNYPYFEWYPRRDIYFTKWIFNKLVPMYFVSKYGKNFIKLQKNWIMSVVLNMNVNYYLEHKDYIYTKTYKPISLNMDYTKYVLVESNKYFDLFKIKNKYIRWEVYLDSASKMAYYQSNYMIQLNMNISQKDKLTYTYNYDRQWKLYLEPYSELDCKNSKVYTWTLAPEIVWTWTYITNYWDTIEKITKNITWATNYDITSLNPNLWTWILEKWQEIIIPKINTHSWETYKVKECQSENKIFVGDELSKLWQKPIFDNTHTKVYDYANEWTIDPEYIKANYPKEYYKENPDWSIDIRLTLYFKPQSYFYLGLIISWTTFLILVFYLIIDSIRVRRKNK